jgi:hypothetical protein
MSKHDYNYSLLLTILSIGATVLGMMSIAALVMFLTAFM